MTVEKEQVEVPEAVYVPGSKDETANSAPDPLNPVFRLSLDDIQREPTITLVIEEPVYGNGKGTPTVEGEKPVKVNERKVVLRAVDVTGISTIVANFDRIDFQKDPEAFWKKCRQRLANLLGVKVVSQKYLNQLTGIANSLIEPQKKSDSDTSES